MKRTVNIIGNLQAGKGLASDARVLESMLSARSWEVRHVGYQERRAEKADLNLHLEVYAPKLFRFAAKNVLIPNIEFYRLKLHGRLPYDAVWAKTRHAHNVLKAHGKDSIYVGFTTEDLYRPEIPRERRFLHVSGGSAYRNTQACIDAWSQNWREGMPELTVLSRLPYNICPGVRLILGPVPRERLIELMNACLLHLLPSGMEGYGQALWEGYSTGAVVITTDAPPMNEGPAAGFIQSCGTIEIAPDRLVKAHQVNPRNIWNGVRWGFTSAFLDRMGSTARRVWEDERQAFSENLDRALTNLFPVWRGHQYA